MKRHEIIFNKARGETVDQERLWRTVQSKYLLRGESATTIEEEGEKEEDEELISCFYIKGETENYMICIKRDVLILRILLKILNKYEYIACLIENGKYCVWSFVNAFKLINIIHLEKTHCLFRK